MVLKTSKAILKNVQCSMAQLFVVAEGIPIFTACYLHAHIDLEQIVHFGFSAPIYLELNVLVLLKLFTSMIYLFIS